MFAQAREKARQASCLSNEKQIGLAAMSYIADYDEQFPPNDAQWAGFASDWTGLLQPYVKLGTAYARGGVFACPSYPRDETTQYKVLDNVFGWMDGATTPPTPRLVSMADIDEPANKLMAFESGSLWSVGDTDPNHNWGFRGVSSAQWFWGANPRADYSLTKGDCDGVAPDGTPAGNWQGCNTYPRYRHTGTSNFLFIDGHAKAMARKALSYDKHIHNPKVNGALW